MHRVLAIVSALVACWGVFGCGGGHKTPVAARSNLTQPHARSCVSGQGHLGCSVPHQVGVNFRRVGLPPNQGLFPDVYEGDAVYSWSTASPHIVGAIVKAYEYRQDGQFVSSWNALRALHKWHSAYIFLHSSCSAVYSYMAVVNANGGFNQPNTGPPVIDAETPDAAGAVGCAVAITESMTHRIPIIYTAPGTWPGGNHGDAYEWAAGYGNYSHSPCIWTCNSIGWQFTDGQYGPYPHQIPGIQPGDISVSYGIQRLVVNTPPPGPSHQQIVAAVNAKRAAKNAYERLGCGRHPMGNPCPHYRRLVMAWQHWLEVKAGYKHVYCWGSAAQRSQAVCTVVRPGYAAWLRYAADSRQNYWGHKCQKHPRTARCREWARETQYGNGHARAIFSQNTQHWTPV